MVRLLVLKELSRSCDTSQGLTRLVLVSVSQDWSQSRSHKTGLNLVKVLIFFLLGVSLSLDIQFYSLLGLGLEFWLTLVSVSSRS